MNLLLPRFVWVTCICNFASGAEPPKNSIPSRTFIQDPAETKVITFLREPIEKVRLQSALDAEDQRQTRILNSFTTKDWRIVSHLAETVIYNGQSRTAMRYTLQRPIRVAIAPQKPADAKETPKAQKAVPTRR